MVASDSDLKDLVSKLGVIRVEVHQVKVQGRHAASKDSAKPRALNALPEKALKGQALSHQARYEPLVKYSNFINNNVPQAWDHGSGSLTYR